MLGQKIGQAIKVASRCLWDVRTDVSASVNHENETMYCVCQVITIRHTDEYLRDVQGDDSQIQQCMNVLSYKSSYLADFAINQKHGDFFSLTPI